MNAPGNTLADFTLTIEGMSCAHCVKAVHDAMTAAPGVVVRSVAVGSALIAAADGPTVARALAALGEEGYAARASEVRPGGAAGAASGSRCSSGA